MKNKNIWLIGLLIILVFIAIGISKLSSKGSGQTIKLGVLLPFTGSGADQGEWIKQGLDLALADVNQGNKKVELVYQDSKGDPKTAISTYNQIKTQYNIPVVFSWGSGVGLALTPLVNNDHIIQMGVATAATAYTTPNDFTFRIFPAANLESEFLVDSILNNLKISSVIVMKINNDYGLSSAKAFKELYQKSGGKILAEETFEPNSTDFRTQLAKIKPEGASLIYLATYPNEGALLLKQAKDQGINTQFIAAGAILGGKNFFSLAQGAAEGLMVVNSVPPINANSSAETKKFAAAYKDAYHEDIGVQQLYASRAYDALKIIAFEIEKCGNITDCLKDELFKVKDYRGASGITTYDENGDILGNFNLQVIKNGQFVKF